jgi:anaphase-promoting complex subunit 8
MRDRKQLNAINLYLLGVILKQKNCKEEAKEVFIEALNKMPLLWSAWLELAQLTQQKDARATVFDKLRPHWAKNFYYACFFLDKQQAKDSIDLNSALYRHFKDSVYIMNQIAHASYIAQEYDVAIDWFQRLLRADPYRYENLDLYSNILYIKENYGELANLAFNIF